MMLQKEAMPGLDTQPMCLSSVHSQVTALLVWRLPWPCRDCSDCVGAIWQLLCVCQKTATVTVVCLFLSDLHYTPLVLSFVMAILTLSFLVRYPLHDVITEECIPEHDEWDAVAYTL